MDCQEIRDAPAKDGNCASSRDKDARAAAKKMRTV